MKSVLSLVLALFIGRGSKYYHLMLNNTLYTFFVVHFRCSSERSTEDFLVQEIKNKRSLWDNSAWSVSILES